MKQVFLTDQEMELLHNLLKLGCKEYLELITKLCFLHDEEDSDELLDLSIDEIQELCSKFNLIVNIDY